MRPRSRQVCALGCGLLMASACATPGRGGREEACYRFPAAFEVTQSLHVEVSARERYDFLASLRRTSGDLEVTLFDPALALPWLVATLRGGEERETILGPGARPGDGRRLLRVLSDLYQATYPLPAESAAQGSRAAGAPEQGAERRAMGMVYRLSGLPAQGDPCAFPRYIEVAPQGGGGPRVRAESLSVACR